MASKEPAPPVVCTNSTVAPLRHPLTCIKNRLQLGFLSQKNFFALLDARHPRYVIPNRLAQCNGFCVKCEQGARPCAARKNMECAFISIPPFSPAQLAQCY